MKELIIGQLEEQYNPEKHILISPYNVVNNWQHFPNWTQWSFEPDPIQKPSDFIYYQKIITAISNEVLLKFSAKYNLKNEVNKSIEYWKVILYPWITTLIQTLVERQERIRQLIKKYKEIDIKVKLIKNNINWKFTDTLEFQQKGSLGLLFNEWLFSRILEESYPNNWTIEWVDKSEEIDNFISEEKSRIQKLTVKGIIKKFIDKRVKRSHISGVYGMDIKDILYFNSIIMGIKVKNKLIKDSHFKLQSINIDKRFKWIFNYQRIVDSVIPQSINNFLPKKEKKKSKNLIIVSSGIWFDDLELKPFIAQEIENGSTVIGCQHGGHNYGTGETYLGVQEIEYSLNGFITWGWKEQSGFSGNFLPVASPFLSKFLNKHTNKNNKIILVGTLTRMLTHRVQSNLQPNKQIVYLKDKILFISSLANKVYNNLEYRFYGGREGCIDDKKFILSHFPDIQLNERNFHKELINCKLLVLDHLGTTLNIAMVANVPLIYYWRVSDTPLSESSKYYFKKMMELGVLYNNPEDAAAFLNENIDNIQKWWYSKDIQDLRLSFCDNYAIANDRWKRDWTQLIKSL